MRVRDRALRATIAALAVAANIAAAQDYPAKPIQMLVPFPPGGIVDIMGRGFAQALDGRIGQRVLVVNRPGGGLTIGMVALAQAPADGYTVIYSPVTPITIQPHRMKTLAYTREAIVPICQTFENMFFVAVGPKSQFSDFQSLVAFAKANPGKLRYVTPGIASSPHLAGAELWRKAGVELTDVPYAGEASAFPHLLTGEVDLGIITTSGVASQKLKPLAVFAPERVKLYPNVPTVAELGLPVLPSGYGGLFVRGGTPAPIMARLEAACREATGDAAYQDLAERQFQQSSYLDRDAFAARIDADYKTKAALIPTLKLPE
jgi:tripartite-type tricarboxylate transporter receptor subunit TctC